MGRCYNTQWRVDFLLGCLATVRWERELELPYASVYRNTERKRGHTLTPKMVEFIDLYILHGSATQAAKESSYATGTHPDRVGQRLLAHPLIREEINKRLDKRSKKFEVTAEYLVEKLAAIVNRTEEDNPQAALRAIELLGKTIAIWKDRQEITGADGEAIKLEQQTKENAADFSRRISGLAKRAGTSNVVEFPDGSRTSSS